MAVAAAMEMETQEEHHTPRLLSVVVMFLPRFLLWAAEQEHKVPLLLLLALVSNQLRFLLLVARVML
jgi:hypothetical protein